MSCLRVGFVEAETDTGFNDMWLIEGKLPGKMEGQRMRQGKETHKGVASSRVNPARSGVLGA